jgi:TolA-binding protein
MSAKVSKRSNINAGLLVIVICCLVAAWSCAYFNTLYNARRIYREAEEKREKGTGGEREMRDSYEEVVTKCAKIVRDYPNSRWVDDALFLMGKALVRQGETDKGIRKFIELVTNFPKSDYVPKSIYWLGLAYYEKGDYNQALVYSDRFLKEYPESNLRNEVMFLAGDLNRELEQEEEALSFYSRVAEESSDGETVDEATLKTAELFYAKGDWEKAAAAYARVLRKGISWERRYEISLALGECYTSIGRCEEALGVYDGLLQEIVSSKEKPPVVLGRGASYVCMDSLETALSILKGVTGEFPRSTYSAEAYYRIGVIFHEKLDSLSRAQEAFAKVAGEYANSDFAEMAIQKSTSIKRLLELEQSSGEDVGGRERFAEKKFLAAEIQLTRLEEIDLAITNYTAVLDSFPRSSYAPQAAYAVAWIYDKKKREREAAIEMYRRVISFYPRSPQALGAIERLGTLGALELKERMQGLIDSAMVDTTGIDGPEEIGIGDGAGVDSLAVPPPPGTTDAPPAGQAQTSVVSDSTSARPPDTTVAPTTVPSPTDTTETDGKASDSTRTQPPDTAGVRED